jgi:LysM repeat protein
MFARVLLVLLAAVVLWAVLARSSAATGPEHRYVVRPTDTLWSIAERHYAGDPRAGVWGLQQRNGLRSTVITPGEVLVLP